MGPSSVRGWPEETCRHNPCSDPFVVHLDVRDGHTEKLFPGIPEGLAGLAVYVDETAFEVVHEDGVGGLLDEALEAVLAPASASSRSLFTSTSLSSRSMAGHSLLMFSLVR